MAEKRYIISETIDDFRKHLILEEKSRATVEKYIRDVKVFKEYITVEAVQRGEAMVSCKGKMRAVFIVKKLKRDPL